MVLHMLSLQGTVVINVNSLCKTCRSSRSVHTDSEWYAETQRMGLRFQHLHDWIHIIRLVSATASVSTKSMHDETDW
jgi:hypothetical protein